MEVLILGLPTKDLPEDPRSNKDRQKESTKPKAVYQGQYFLEKGEPAGPEVATALALGVSFLFTFAEVMGHSDEETEG